ncbi:FadR/GntR family transcriptional regulator [Streptomyces sp. NPDC004542]|uniref:FadR/GntR family transcriptional regulator n=1 Tax=Streptomyces sp. NPDC004542 TaxID=3154281 RepID=UPI0033B39265
MSERMASPVRQTPLVLQVADQFRSLIDDGTWAVGSKIPGELQLAADLGVSRGTVREALRALSVAGLLQPKVGDGTYVRAQDELTALLMRGRTAGGLEQALDVRSILEVAAAVRAADNRTDADIDDLTGALEMRARANRALDAAAYVHADLRFHSTLVRASGNPFLAKLYQAIGQSMEDSIAQTASLPEDPELERLHRALAQAVADRDREAAGTIAQQMFDEVGFLSAVTSADE